MTLPIIVEDLTRPDSYFITNGPKGSPFGFGVNSFKDEAEALKAWRLWNQSTKVKRTLPSAPRIPSLTEARKRGICMQCLRPDSNNYRAEYRSWRTSPAPKGLEACGMNLCPACYAVHQRSIAAGLRPSVDVPFDLEPVEPLQAVQ